MSMEKIEKEERVGPSPVSEIAFKAEFIYFFLFVAGMVLSALFPGVVLESNLLLVLGGIFLALAPIIIYWAQFTSSKFRKKSREETTASDFCKGPYRYTRNPTYFGVTLLFLGFAFIIGSVFLIIAALIGWMLAYFSFRKKEERRLTQLFGDAYKEYRQKVRSWL